MQVKQCKQWKQCKQCEQCTRGLWGSVSNLDLRWCFFIWSFPGDLCFECGELDKVGSDEAGVLHQIWIVQVNTIWGKHAKPRNDLAKLGNREVDFQYSIFRPRFHEREVFPSHREVVMIQNNGKNRFVWSMIRDMVEMIILLGWWYDHDNDEIRITMFSG